MISSDVERELVLSVVAWYMMPCSHGDLEPFCVLKTKTSCQNPLRNLQYYMCREEYVLLAICFEPLGRVAV